MDLGFRFCGRRFWGAWTPGLCEFVGFSFQRLWMWGSGVGLGLFDILPRVYRYRNRDKLVLLFLFGNPLRIIGAPLLDPESLRSEPYTAKISIGFNVDNNPDQQEKTLLKPKPQLRMLTPKPRTLYTTDLESVRSLWAYPWPFRILWASVSAPKNKIQIRTVVIVRHMTYDQQAHNTELYNPEP